MVRASQPRTVSLTSLTIDEPYRGQAVGFLIEKIDFGTERHHPVGEGVEIVEFRAVELLKQHRRHDRLAMLGLQREVAYHVGFGGKQMDGRPSAAPKDFVHDKSRSMNM